MADKGMLNIAIYQMQAYVPTLAKLVLDLGLQIRAKAQQHSSKCYRFS